MKKEQTWANVSTWTCSCSLELNRTVFLGTNFQPSFDKDVGATWNELGYFQNVRKNWVFWATNKFSSKVFIMLQGIYHKQRFVLSSFNGRYYWVYHLTHLRLIGYHFINLNGPNWLIYIALYYIKLYFIYFSVSIRIYLFCIKWNYILFILLYSFTYMIFIEIYSFWFWWIILHCNIKWNLYTNGKFVNYK